MPYAIEKVCEMPLAHAGKPTTYLASVGGYILASSTGELFTWREGEVEWVHTCSILSGQNTVHDLIVYNNVCYVGTENGGRLFSWNGSRPSIADGGAGTWVQEAALLAETKIYSTAEFNGKIYGGTGNLGKLYEHNLGSGIWSEVASQLNGQIYIDYLIEYNSKLYGGAGIGGRLFEWNGVNAWTQVAGQYDSVTRLYSGCILDGSLYFGGGIGANLGHLLKWNDVDAFTSVTNTPLSNNIHRTITYDGGIWATADTDMKLVRWNGSDDWTDVYTFAATAYGLVEHEGALYVSLVNGELYKVTRTADFSGTPLSGTAPLTVQFTDLS